eukprot:Hpha_TRINITY_DN3960_c0_g1::TRINITY_DN3960_c0_g1_i1::g.18016::m.18016
MPGKRKRAADGAAEGPPTAAGLLTRFRELARDVEAVARVFEGEVDLRKREVAKAEFEKERLSQEIAQKREAARRDIEDDIAQARAAAEREIEEQRRKLALLEKQVQKLTRVSAQVDEVIEINVGGETVASQRGTLCVVEDSMLAAMFSGRWEGQLATDKQGRLFVDWDPHCFRKILAFLRSIVMLGPDRCLPPPPSVDAHMETEFKGLVNYLGLDQVIYPPPSAVLPRASFAAGKDYTLTKNATVATSTSHEYQKASCAVGDGGGYKGNKGCIWKVMIEYSNCCKVGVVYADEIRQMQKDGRVELREGSGWFLGCNNKDVPFWYHGAMVSVRLDCRRGTLSLSVSSTEYGVADPCHYFDGVDVSRPLVLVCQLPGPIIPKSQTASVRFVSVTEM